MRKDLHSKFSPRQYMMSEDYEVFYYSDTNLATVKEHTHNYYEFYFFLEGDMSMTVDGKTYIMQPRDFYFIPPGTPHFPTMLRAEKPYRRFVLWISQDYFQYFKSTAGDYAYLADYVTASRQHCFANDVVNFNTIQSLLFQIIEEIRGRRFGRETEIALLISSLLLYLNRMVYEQNNSKGAESEKDLYAYLCQYIEHNLAEDLSLDKIAEELFLSKFYISHIFKSQTGISLHQFITQKRLHACKNAILNGDVISKVYGHYGFHDYSAFFRAFKKEFGLSPKEYGELFTRRERD